jgi:uncharacterized NAD-dependent epimerase/dehydratase family protein
VWTRLVNLHDAFDAPVPTIVLAEGGFGEPGGETANAVVLGSDLFAARAVVDSTRAGLSARDVLNRADAPELPVVESVAAALAVAPGARALVIGVAPAGGALPAPWEAAIREAIRGGCDVVSGLRVLLGEDDEWRALADEHGVRLFDLRRPPEEGDRRVADGSVDDRDADVVATLGTDCAVGERTTAVELCRAARAAGVDAGRVATGRTGVVVGADAGVVVDGVPAAFAAGVVEDLVSTVAADHDLVFVEGRGALRHRGSAGVTLAILHGAWPDAVVLADDPGRERRTGFERFAAESLAETRALVESLSDATVAGVSTRGDPGRASAEAGLPAANVRGPDGPERLLEAVRDALDGGEAGG